MIKYKIFFFLNNLITIKNISNLIKYAEYHKEETINQFDYRYIVYAYYIFYFQFILYVTTYRDNIKIVYNQIKLYANNL